MVISSAVNGNKDFNKIIEWDEKPELGKWTSIAISQTYGDDKTYTYQIEVGGKTVFSEKNNQPKEFSNVKVYASDPWHPSQACVIQSLAVQRKLPGNSDILSL